MATAEPVRVSIYAPNAPTLRIFKAGQDGVTQTPWAIVSDGLDGIGFYDIAFSSTSYAAIPGAHFDGSKVEARILTFEFTADFSSYPISQKQQARDDVYLTFDPTQEFRIQVMYGASGSSFAEIFGRIRNFQLSDGNIFDRTTLKVSFECAWPFFKLGESTFYNLSTNTATVSLTAEQTKIGQLSRIPYIFKAYPSANWDTVEVAMGERAGGTYHSIFKATGSQKFNSSQYFVFDTTKRPIVAGQAYGDYDGAINALAGLNVVYSDLWSIQRGYLSPTWNVAFKNGTDAVAVSRCSVTLPQYLLGL